MIIFLPVHTPSEQVTKKFNQLASCSAASPSATITRTFRHRSQRAGRLWKISSSLHALMRTRHDSRVLGWTPELHAPADTIGWALVDHAPRREESPRRIRNQGDNLRVAIGKFRRRSMLPYCVVLFKMMGLPVANFGELN